MNVVFFIKTNAFLYSTLLTIGAVWIDQGFMLVSQDITERLVQRIENGTLPCSPWLDQAFATWMNDYPDIIMLGDNKRLAHDLEKMRLYTGEDEMKGRKEICQTYLGIHQSYPEEMRMYWSVYQQEKKLPYNVPHLKYNCAAKRMFDHKRMLPAWNFKQKPCKDNPIWGKGEVFYGRQFTDGEVQM